MGNIFTSMSSTAGAMQALQRSLNIVQNNIVNASSAGYVRQDASLVAKPFNPDSNSVSGGVSPGITRSGRDPFLESAVWRSQHKTENAGALTTKLSEVERSFPLASGAGISGELDRFFASVSQWSISPNSPVSRRQVLDRAGALAQSFNQTALELGEVSARSGADLSSTVRTVNRLTADIATLNTQRRQSPANALDAGMDATLHAKLEELAQYVEFTALPQEDGSVSVFLGGQTAAVIGDRQWSISLNPAGAGYQILDSEGADITPRLRQAKLGGLLEFHNTLLPGFRARLDALASGFADRVNATLNAGLDQNGVPPVRNLFSYDTGIGAAATLSLTGITDTELAAAAPGDPGGNTNALDLAALQTTAFLSGLTPSQSFGDLAATVGDRLNAEKSNQDLQQQLLLQARNLRSELSGVDVNVEATKLLQLQQGFQAAGQVFSVLNSLTETVINLIR